MKKMLMTAALLSASLNLTAAEDNIIFLGGGGEPKNAANTQFDQSVRNLGDFVKSNKNYSTTIVFNGGHSDTESIIADKFKSAENVGPFTASNYKAVIQDAIAKLSKNPPEIPAGGKLLVFINSHGGEKAGKTHNISTSGAAMTNMNSVSESSSVSLDLLEDLAKLAETKNIKLAIVDGSCHAGNSLPLANKNTCVVAASGPNHYAYSNFADIFAGKMKKGKTIEDIFLETRNETAGGGFPMISTPEGIEVQNEIYPYLTPYLYYHDEYRGMSLDKIDNYIKDNLEDELQCKRENDYLSLKRVITLIEQLNEIEKKSLFSSTPKTVKTVDLTDLKKKLDEYKKTQDEYFRKLKELNLASLDDKETITTDFYTRGNTYTHREILATDYKDLAADKEKDLQTMTLTPEKRKNYERLRDFYLAAQVTKEKLLRDHPQYIRQKELFDSLKEDALVGFSVASEISGQAHKAYNAYYKNKQKELIRQSQSVENPCRDFVL